MSGARSEYDKKLDVIKEGSDPEEIKEAIDFVTSKDFTVITEMVLGGELKEGEVRKAEKAVASFDQIKKCLGKGGEKERLCKLIMANTKIPPERKAELVDDIIAQFSGHTVKWKATIDRAREENRKLDHKDAGKENGKMSQMDREVYELDKTSKTTIDEHYRELARELATSGKSASPLVEEKNKGSSTEKEVKIFESSIEETFAEHIRDAEDMRSRMRPDPTTERVTHIMELNKAREKLNTQIKEAGFGLLEARKLRFEVDAAFVTAADTWIAMKDEQIREATVERDIVTAQALKRSRDAMFAETNKLREDVAKRNIRTPTAVFKAIRGGVTRLFGSKPAENKRSSMSGSVSKPSESAGESRPAAGVGAGGAEKDKVDAAQLTRRNSRSPSRGDL